MGQRCDICGDSDLDAVGIPDAQCWDSRATAEQIAYWVRRVEAYADDPARRLLANIGDPSAAPAIRTRLDSSSPAALTALITSLGWSGDHSDGPLLIRMTRHEEPSVRVSAFVSLTDLEIPGAADILADALTRSTEPNREQGRLLECLAWLRDGRARPLLREREQAQGYATTLASNPIVDALARVSTEEDHTRIARAACASLEDAAVTTTPQYRDLEPWIRYWMAFEPVAPELTKATWESLSDAARARAAGLYFHRTGEPVLVQPHGPRVVPKRSMARYVDSPPSAAFPPAKFCGQPDWREEPAWPIGGDGVQLMFGGQLPIEGNRTAYLFTAGPEDWEPLGPGSAVVIQPGNFCHLPTISAIVGPQAYDSFVERSRLVRRIRRGPAKERYVVLENELDPAEWPSMTNTPDWNKMEGTPIWLQGERYPEGNGWSYAFQFDSDNFGHDRGDGAVMYGWINADGRGAMGWDCH